MRPLLVVCGLIAGSIGGCCLVYKAVTYKDAQGHPIATWAGDNLQCRKCDGGTLAWQKDHQYQCRQCGQSTIVRLIDTGLEYDHGSR